MKSMLQIFLFTACLLVSSVNAAENSEIGYLLSFISSSDCTFIRNGKEYTAVKASEHLEYKYNHVKSRIKTADQFIDKIASKSSISKKPYEVRCGDTQFKTEQWLVDALNTHRKSTGK